ncbi:hypothetical protein [Staphylococcus warneri]|nr:hypothetical protein [Staphylococcus warneri]
MSKEGKNLSGYRLGEEMLELLGRNGLLEFRGERRRCRIGVVMLG